MDRAALGGHVLLLQGEGSALGDLDLLGDDVDSRHHLRNRVLDLEPGVDLHEPELPLLLVVEELDGAGVDVAGMARHPDGRPAHGIHYVAGNGGSRGRLEELLMAPLDGAVPGAQMDHLAVGVGQDLDFDVARRHDALLRIDRIVIEEASSASRRA